MNFSQLGFGAFVFKTQGIMLALSFFVSAWYYYKSIQKHNFPVDFFVHHFWRWILMGAFVARIVTLCLYPEIFETYGWFSFFAFWQGEVNVPIFLLVFLITMYFDLRDQQFSFWRWLDLAVEPLLIFLILENLAAFITGYRYGIATDLPWGVRYETFGVAEVNPVHPVTLYSAVVYVITLLYYKKEALKNNWKDKVLKGKLFYRFLLVILFTEGFLFFIRGDIPSIQGTGISKEFLVFIAVTFLLILGKNLIVKRSKNI
ncbi:hypothetical protein CSB37_02815 [bacterium DOLZORAL124_38_8]|nr:MAG: hypothetical protein CSB37_02815 [bacterium DOLZORAL124_38_8]